MSKKVKILIIVVILVLIVPFGYKQYINKTIMSNINNLSNKGFLVVKKEDNGGYLSTQQSYKLVLSNTDIIYKEFLSKIFTKTQASFMKNIFSMLKGSEITVDLNILNFPVPHKNAINIYLTSLPAKAKQNIASKLLLNEVSTFLENRGFGENISINALNKITSIKLKNIDIVFDDKKANLKIKVKDYISNVRRFDIYNNNYGFITKNDIFNFNFTDGNRKNIDVGYSNLKCDIDRKNLYNSQLLCSIANFNFEMQKYKKQILKLDNIFISSASKLKQDMINYQFKYKIKDTYFQSLSKYNRKNSINLKDFEYNGNIAGIHKDVFDRLSNMSYNTPKFYLSKQYQNIILKLINDGFSFNIDNFGVSSLDINNKTKNISLGNIKMKMDLKILKNDIKFSKRFRPIELLRYLNINAKVTLQKKDWDYIQSVDKRKKLSIARKLVKFAGNKVIFNIVFLNKKLTINNKKIF